MASIGEVLFIQIHLKEGMVDVAATNAAKGNLDRLGQGTLAAKEQFAEIKQRQEHEREAKASQTEGRTSSGMLTLRAKCALRQFFLKAISVHNAPLQFLRRYQD